MDHVANVMQNIHHHLDTQLQQMKSTMQATKLQITAVTHGTRQYYVVCQDYGGNRYHGNQSSYRSLGGRVAQNNKNLRGGRGG